MTPLIAVLLVTLVAQVAIVLGLVWLLRLMNQSVAHLQQAITALGVPAPEAPIPDEVGVRMTVEDEWLKERFRDRTFGEPLEESGWPRS